jgi:hypothetical protein
MSILLEQEYKVVHVLRGNHKDEDETRVVLKLCFETSETFLLLAMVDVEVQQEVEELKEVDVQQEEMDVKEERVAQEVDNKFPEEYIKIKWRSWYNRP